MGRVANSEHSKKTGVILFYIIMILYALAFILFLWGPILAAAFFTSGFIWTGVITLILTIIVWVGAIKYGLFDHISIPDR